MRLAAALLATLLVSGVTAAADYQEGAHFRRLPAPQPTAAGKGQVEVLEFFSWGCPHCYALEPYLQRGLVKNKPANVVFTRVPANFPQFRALARAYYVAEALKVAEKVNQPVFDALHAPQSASELRIAYGELLRAEQRRDAGEIASAQAAFDDAMAKLFQQHAGVKPEDYKSMSGSFGINKKLAESDALYRRYQITGVPNMTVAGKYYVGAGVGLRLESYAQFVDVIAWLAAREAAAVR